MNDVSHETPPSDPSDIPNQALIIEAQGDPDLLELLEAREDMSAYFMKQAESGIPRTASENATGTALLNAIAERKIVVRITPEAQGDPELLSLLEDRVAMSAYFARLGHVKTPGEEVTERLLLDKIAKRKTELRMSTTQDS